MELRYILGITLAILSGATNNLGVLLQKKVVNEVPPQFRTKAFLRTLIKNPLWLLGLFLQVALGMLLFVSAVSIIGPALVPGLMASGLILLALGSVKLMKEKLSPSEYLGILLMIAGITLLGLSQMSINADLVRKSLSSSQTILRIVIFTTLMTLSCIAFHFISLKSKKRKGIIMGFSNGFLFSLSNFWISPLTSLIPIVLTGKANLAQTIIFISASIILIATNIIAFSQIQIAFKFAQASNIIPVQQISVQITPILIYFLVLSLSPPKSTSTIFICLGAILIISAGFLLGTRQQQLEKTN